MMKPYSKEDAARHLEKLGYCIMTKRNMDQFISCGYEAFKNYSIYKYFFNEKNYERKVEIAIESLVRITGSKGLLYADSEKVNGFAQFFPPNFSGHSSWSYVMSGSWKLMFLSDFLNSTKRVDFAEGFAFRKKYEITKNQDIFLYNLAVRPTMQKKGIAKKLVQPMMEYAKSINRPIYCETYEENNVTIYKHLGFQALESTKLAGTDITHYPMLYKVD